MSLIAQRQKCVVRGSCVGPHSIKTGEKYKEEERKVVVELQVMLTISLVTTVKLPTLLVAKSGMYVITLVLI